MRQTVRPTADECSELVVCACAYRVQVDVQRVRQLLADLLHVLPEFESLKHGRVPLILEQLDERRDAVGGRRSRLDDLA